MRRGASEALSGQARTLVAAAEAAARWFRRPAPSALSAARTARLRAQGWRDAAVAAQGALAASERADAAELSFSLREAAEHAAQAVSEAARYGVEGDPALLAEACAVEAASRAFARAAEGKGSARAESLVEAKRWALEAERLHRQLRRQAQDDPSLTAGLKRETVGRRLSDAAEALHQACDALAGSLAA